MLTKEIIPVWKIINKSQKFQKLTSNFISKRFLFWYVELITRQLSVVKSFLQLVYMLLYYPTLQHAFITKFVLRKYSCLLFLFKEFAFSHFFSKIAQESRHSIKHCTKALSVYLQISFSKNILKSLLSVDGSLNCFSESTRSM